jgi:anti-sigma-K factor RskA
MDALDGANRLRFERHLAKCGECSQELTGLREAAARLAAAAAEQPPAALRGRLLAETARTRQLPPLTSGPPAVLRRPRASAALRLGLGAVGVAAVTAGVVWLTGIGARPARPAPAPQAPPGPVVAAVLTAPDATMVSGQVKTGGTVTVVMSYAERRLVVAAAGLRALPGSRCYELWLVKPGGRGADRPAGLLAMSRRGMAGPVVASGLRAGDRLGISVEPASGTARPTSSMILLMAL